MGDGTMPSGDGGCEGTRVSTVKAEDPNQQESSQRQFNECREERRGGAERKCERAVLTSRASGGLVGKKRVEVDVVGLALRKLGQP